MASRERQLIRWSKLEQPHNDFLKCVICNYSGLNEYYKKYICDDIFNAGTIIRHQCPNCDLIFGDLRFINLSLEEINNDYCDTYSYFQEGENTLYILNSLCSLELFKNREYSYLDYACGIGKMIPILRNAGYNINGYDAYVKNSNVLENIDNMIFDVIYANNFIEHLVNPLEDIKKILKHLSKDGYLIFISDCIDEYIVENTHFHTYYYLGRSLILLFDTLNLEIIEKKSIDPCKIIVLRRKVVDSISI